MISAERVLIMAEMHGRDLLRRHVALLLLIALPLAFYATSAGQGPSAATSGGLGMAFAVAGATLFSVLSSRAADQRLVLSGYRPVELLLGRLLFLGPLALVISAGFSVVMVIGSPPERPWVMGVGVAVVALQSVPLGLAVGAVVPRELEGTLVVIGVVGVQLATRLHTLTSEVLPFYGARSLLAGSLHTHGALAWPLAETAAYGLALMLVARLGVARRVAVVRHPRLGAPA